MDCQNWFLEGLKVVLPSAVAAVGWYVVHEKTQRRERDKSRRELVIKISEGLAARVDEVFSSARRYHLLGERDQAAEIEIKMKLQDLSMQISLLHDCCEFKADPARASDTVKRLRQAVTGQHFEDEHSGALEQTDSQLQAIAERVGDAKRALMYLRVNQIGPR